jgi:hypothetical protein
MANQQKSAGDAFSAPVPATEVDVNAVLQEAAAKGSLSDAKFSALLSLMMAKEARLAEKEAFLEQQTAAREEERKKESERYTITIIENQRACKHLKGGAGRTRSQQRDPAVYMHTFADGKAHIKCQLCKAKWMPKDTADYLDRNGSKIPNWTGIGWREAVMMAEDSSNRPSSSERFFGGVREEYVSDTAREIAKAPNLQF